MLEKKALWYTIAAAVILGPILIFLFVPDYELANLGASGDFAASIIGGLGFLGFVLVLFIDSRNRRDDLRRMELQEKPLLVPEIASESGQIVEARSLDDGNSSVVIEIECKIINLTDHPAMNVKFDGTVASLAVSAEHARASVVMRNTAPIARSISEPRQATVKFNLNGEEADRLMKLLHEERSISIVIKMTYENLSGVAWTSESNYSFSVTRKDSLEKLKEVLEYREEGQLLRTSTDHSGGGSIIASVVADPVSWKHYSFE